MNWGSFFSAWKRYATAYRHAKKRKRKYPCRRYEHDPLLPTDEHKCVCGWSIRNHETEIPR